MGRTVAGLSSERGQVLSVEFFHNGARVRITTRVKVSRTRIDHVRGNTLSAVGGGVWPWIRGDYSIKQLFYIYVGLYMGGRERVSWGGAGGRFLLCFRAFIYWGFDM